MAASARLRTEKSTGCPRFTSHFAWFSRSWMLASVTAFMPTNATFPTRGRSRTWKIKS